MKWKFSQAYLQFFQFQKRFTITVTHSFNTTIPQNSNTTLYVLVNLHVLRIYMYLSVLHQFLNWSVWRFLRSTPTKLPSPSIRTAIIFFFDDDHRQRTILFYGYFEHDQPSSDQGDEKILLRKQQTWMFYVWLPLDEMTSVEIHQIW